MTEVEQTLVDHFLQDAVLFLIVAGSFGIVGWIFVSWYYDRRNNRRD